MRHVRIWLIQLSCFTESQSGKSKEQICDYCAQYRTSDLPSEILTIREGGVCWDEEQRVEKRESRPNGQQHSNPCSSQPRDSRYFHTAMLPYRPDLNGFEHMHAKRGFHQQRLWSFSKPDFTGASDRLVNRSAFSVTYSLPRRKLGTLTWLLHSGIRALKSKTAL